jgi:hypothetical protein
VAICQLEQLLVECRASPAYVPCWKGLQLVWRGTYGSCMARMCSVCCNNMCFCIAHLSQQQLLWQCS